MFMKNRLGTVTYGSYCHCLCNHAEPIIKLYMKYISYYNGDYISVWHQNYVTTNVTVPLVIYISFFIILFKSESLTRLLYIMNTVGLIYILITSNCIYTNNQISVYNVNKKVNLYIDLRNLISINICLVFLIQNC